MELDLRLRAPIKIAVLLVAIAAFAEGAPSAARAELGRRHARQDGKVALRVRSRAAIDQEPAFAASPNRTETQA